MIPTDDQIREKVEYLLDLSTDKLIEENPDCTVVESAELLWGTIAEQYGYDSPEAARQGFLEKQSAVENQNGTVTIHSEAGNVETWYFRHDSAWNTIRGQLDQIKHNVEKVLLYNQKSTPGALVEVKAIREGLKPGVGLTADEVERLLESEVSIDTTDGESDDLSNTFAPADHWQAAGRVSEELAAWSGNAAVVFKAVYTDRMPTLLLGQMIVAAVLDETLEIAHNAFWGVHTETATLLDDVIVMIESYPDVGSGPAESSVNWEKTLNIVSGVASMVAAAAAPIPGVGTGIAVGAGLVSGAATIGSQFVSDGESGHAELVATEVPVQGETVRDILSNFDERVGVYVQAVINMERYFGTKLAEFDAFVAEDGETCVTVLVEHGADVTVNRRNAYFVPKVPALASISGDTGHGTVSDMDHMYIGDSGRDLAAELNQLLLAGHKWLPGLADNYASLAGKDSADGLDAVFQRTQEGYNPAVGEYENSGHGAMYPAWVALRATLTDILSQTAGNLDAAAEGLIATAESYAEHDTAAGAELREISEYL